ncbi:MAG TPA: hypothetical protein VMC81_09155 [Rhodocyclaceae bacterium]|nr:hypothetical protein [Rhodocyclaceae bacterium]
MPHRSSASHLPSGALAYLLGLAIGQPAIAQDASVYVGALNAHYVATERAPGSSWVLNQDSGQLRGFAVEATTKFDALDAGLRLERLRGDLDYDGFTQWYVPLQTTTELQVTRWRLKFGYDMPLAAETFRVRIGLAIGQQEIYRDIQAAPLTGPLTETMTSRGIGAELGLRWAPVAAQGAWTICADVGTERPWRQALDVDTHGAYDRFTLKPAAKDWRSAGLGIRIQPGARWQIELGRTWQRFQFGTAPATLVTRNGQLAAIGSYPGSDQSIDAWSLAIRYVLGP